ncbi:hypothetical protein TSUD_114720 [Trifolium subterraneum]|uniref:Uncharacterized protein n=1 Tax=Trifolium subterraneum TaxID=3900 RepID=A0A2Z6MJN8_TRISU|nr:hypothetical protein TSUD_114720 [Trifolium subterraneum]
MLSVQAACVEPTIRLELVKNEILAWHWQYLQFPPSSVAANLANNKCTTPYGARTVDSDAYISPVL